MSIPDDINGKNIYAFLEKKNPRALKKENPLFSELYYKKQGRERIPNITSGILSNSLIVVLL